MSFKTPLLCDRRVFDKKGKWKSPQNDIEENIFYFVKEPLTVVPEWENGQEKMVETTTICVFGGKPFVKNDNVFLENGTRYRIDSVIINYAESNVLVKDLLKPRIESMDLILK